MRISIVGLKFYILVSCSVIDPPRLPNPSTANIALQCSINRLASVDHCINGTLQGLLGESIDCAGESGDQF